ncbi:MAG: DUF11 domain-containing protein [Planctomycetes bacterium]|nr:DUF11 domain-containing protein [Planctomycetota bacterium]
MSRSPAPRTVALGLLALASTLALTMSATAQNSLPPGYVPYQAPPRRPAAPRSAGIPQPPRRLATPRTPDVEVSPARPIDPGPFTQPVVVETPPVDLGATVNDGGPALAPQTQTAPSQPQDSGTGRPGPKQLDGLQTPSVTIEKHSPKEVQVGQPAKSEIVVRNAGQATAYDVSVRDDVPQGARLIGSKPTPQTGPEGELVWTIGALRANETAKIEIEWMPLGEGELGSVATLQFSAMASSRSRVTRPELTIDVSAPSEALQGETIPYRIKLTNTGTGAANGVVLVDHVPANLEHPAGVDLEQDIGALRPGESRTIDLVMRARAAGEGVNVVAAHAQGGLKVDKQMPIRVLAPALAVGLEGSRRRFLERQATYTVNIANPGTAPAKQVELVAYLPPGVEFLQANHQGRFNQASRSVHWLLEELPAGQQGDVTMTVLPREQGALPLRIAAAAERGLSTERQETIQVEGVAALLFEVADQADPVEVGGETVYLIRVVNQGSKDSMNVQVVALLPSDMKLLSVEAPTRYDATNGVRFQPIPRLAPKAEATFQLRVQAGAPGDHRLRVQVTSDEIHSPITKEESTRVIGE